MPSLKVQPRESSVSSGLSSRCHRCGGWNPRGCGRLDCDVRPGGILREGPPGLGLKEKLALLVVWNFIKGRGIMIDFKSLGLADWLKIIANVAAAGAVGFSTGGYVGLGIAVLVNASALVQAKPGTISIPK